MRIYELSCLFVLLGSVLAPSPNQSKQYRKDYVYNKKTDAFYKFHIEARKSWQAEDICEVEGARLIVPLNHLDEVQIHAMMKEYPDLGSYVWIGSDGQSHESAEENPLIDLTPAVDGDERWIRVDCEVMTRKGEIERDHCAYDLPFICKIEAKDAPYDNHCGVFGTNYVYYQSVGSCYKIPRTVFSWNQAYAECDAEGAHLVIINSMAEHDAIRNFTNSIREVRGAKTSWFFHAGFRADRPIDNSTRVFRTIFNQTLEEAGYSQWAPNEPNNDAGKEYCGSIFKNTGEFNDVNCAHEYAFICEKEVSS